MKTDKLQEFIKEKKGYDDIQALRASYQVNLFLNSLLYTVLIGIVFLLFGFFKEYITIVLFLRFFRINAGGIHLKGKLNCFLSSFTVIFLIMSLSKFVVMNYILETVLLIYSFVIWFILVPQGTSQRPIRKVEEKKKLKYNMLILIILTILTRLIDFEVYTIGLWSLTTVLTLLTPFAYKVFKVKHDRV